MNKGFTLIELLAVLIILGIIALITIPVVNDSLKSTREKSKKMSAKNYIDAVEKVALSKDVVGVPIQNGIYFVLSDGNICFEENYSNSYSCTSDIINIELKGNRPTEGKIKIINNKVVRVFNIKFDKFYVNMVADYDFSISNSKIDTICKSVTDSTPDKVGNIPEKNIYGLIFKPGDEYLCNVNEKTIYRFIILSIDGDNVSLIMNNNIKPGGTIDDKTNPELYKWGDGANTSKGPFSVVESLTRATSKWTNIPKSNVSHIDKGGSYGIVTFNGRARLPYYDEIVANGCGVDTCKWLYANLVSSYHIADSVSENNIYGVYSDGIRIIDDITTELGLRPVIVLDKRDFS